MSANLVLEPTLARVRENLALEKKITKEVLSSDGHRRLYATRIALGKDFEEATKVAKAEGIPWEDYCADMFKLSRRQVDKYRAVARSAKTVMRHADDLPVDLDAAERLVRMWARQEALGVGDSVKSRDRDSDNWITPAGYTDAARQVMGSIDFDPFSSPEANVSVGATQFYTQEDDAFETPWPSTARTVWMNPPYGRGNMQKSVDALLKHLSPEGSSIEQAIVLTNNSTDTEWFYALAHHPRCAAVVFTRGRIAFLSPGDKQMSSNTRGQTFFYFGKNPQLFCEVFGQYGTYYPAAHDCWGGA